MAGARQNSNCNFADMRSYNTEGRPFTMAEFQSRLFVAATRANCDYNSQMCYDSYTGGGRPVNPALDFREDRFEQFQNQTAGDNTEFDSTCDSNSNRFKLYTGEGRPFNPALDFRHYRTAQSSNHTAIDNTEFDSTCDYPGFNPYLEERRPFNPRNARTTPNNQTWKHSTKIDSTCGYDSNVGAGTCTGEGRPFDYNSNVNVRSHVGEGRQVNPALDITCNRAAKSSNHQAVNQLADRQRQLNLEYEMARNKQKALECLQAEAVDNCASQPRSPLDSARQSRDKNPVCSHKVKTPNGSPKGRPLDLRNVKHTQQCKKQDVPYVCTRSRRCNRNSGRPLDLDKPFTYHCAINTPPAPTGRPFDIDRDRAYRCSNLPTPKGQRATSCPTPVQNGTPLTYAQCLPRICPQTTTAVCPPSRTRSASPAVRSSSSNVPNVRNTTMQPLAAPAANRSLRTPISPASQERAATLCSATETKTESFPTPQVSPTGAAPRKVSNISFYHQPTSVCPPPQQQTASSPTPQVNQVGATPRKAPDILSSDQLNSAAYSSYEDRNLDSAIFEGPPQAFVSSPPTQHPYGGISSLQTTNTSFKSTIPDDSSRQITSGSSLRSPATQTNTTKFNVRTTYQSLQKASPPPPLQPRTDPDSVRSRNLSGISSSRSCVFLRPTADRTCERSYISNIPDHRSLEVNNEYRPSTSIRDRRAQNETLYYNACMMQEPSQYNRSYRQRSRDEREISHANSTNETQYQCESMDTSVQAVPCFSRQPTKHDESWRIRLCRVPKADITCYESSSCVENQRQQKNLNSEFQLDQLVETDFDTTQYLELPSNLKSQKSSSMALQTCQPCEQPKASLLRCLGKKLSSTFDYISSFVASQNADNMPTTSANQPLSSTQVCDTTTYGLNSLFQSTCPEGTNYDSRNVGDYQGNNASTYGLSTLFNSTCPPTMARDCSRNVNETQGNDTRGFAIKNLFGNTTDLMNLSNSIRECAIAKRCGRVQFDNSDKSQVQDANRTARRKAELETLVKDSYCPGIIQATVDGQENFNRYSLILSLNKDSPNSTDCQVSPSEDPMTLLEAFSIRIENERTQVEKDIPDNAKPEQMADIIRNYFANQNPTDLNRSIKSLMLSEHLQEQEEQEKSKGTSLDADVEKFATSFADSSKLKLIFYLGHTKPLPLDEAV